MSIGRRRSGICQNEGESEWTEHGSAIFRTASHHHYHHSARFCVNKHLLQLVSHGVSSVETPREIVLLKLVFNKVDSHYIWSIVLVPFSIFFSLDFSGCWEICSSTGCSSWKGERSSAWDPHQHQGEQFRHLDLPEKFIPRNATMWRVPTVPQAVQFWPEPWCILSFTTIFPQLEMALQHKIVW